MFGMVVRVTILITTLVLFAAAPGNGWFVPIEGFARDRPPSIKIESDGAGGVILAANVISAVDLQFAPLTVLRLAPGGKEGWRTVLSESEGEDVTDSWVQGLIIDEAGHAYLSALLLYPEYPRVFFGTVAKIDAASGSIVWQRRIQGVLGGTDLSLPLAVAPDGSVFTAYVGRISRTLFLEKLDGDTGALIWRVDYGYTRGFVRVTTDDEGNALVASEDANGVGYVIKVDGSDGGTSWRFVDGSNSPPLIHAGSTIFYAGSGLPPALDRGVPLLPKLDPVEGRPIWRAGLDPGAYFAAQTVDLAVTPGGMPITATRLVLQIDEDRYENRFGVVAFDAGTGAERWRYLLPEGSRGSDIAVDADGDVFVAGTTDNGLGIYHSDFSVTKIDHELGEAVWNHTVPSLGGGWAEQIAAVGGGAAVAAGIIVNRTTGCGDSGLVAVKLRGDSGDLFAPKTSPTPRPSGRCTDHLLYVTSSRVPLYHESPARGRLAVIDGLTLDPLASIEVGEVPTQVVIDPKRPVAYVVDPGDQSWAEGASVGRVFEIDIPRREIVAEVEVGKGAMSIAISGDGEKLYVSNLLAASVSVLATKPLRILGAIEDMDSPAAVASNELHGEIYVMTEGGVLHVLDTETDQIVRSVRISESAHSVSVSPNGETIFVSGADHRSILSVDAATLEITGEACCPGTDFWAGALALSADGSTGILAHDDGANPVVLDIANGVFEPTAVDCSVAVDGQLAWNGVGSVAVWGDRGYAGPYAVDLRSRTVVGQIEPNDLRGVPRGVAVGPCAEALEPMPEPDDDGCQITPLDGVGAGYCFPLLSGLVLALFNRQRGKRIQQR